MQLPELLPYFIYFDTVLANLGCLFGDYTPRLQVFTSPELQPCGRNDTSICDLPIWSDLECYTSNNV